MVLRPKIILFCHQNTKSYHFRNQWIKIRRVHSLLLHMNIAHLCVTLIYMPKEIIHSYTIAWHGGDLVRRWHFWYHLVTYTIYHSALPSLQVFRCIWHRPIDERTDLPISRQVLFDIFSALCYEGQKKREKNGISFLGHSYFGIRTSGMFSQLFFNFKLWWSSALPFQNSRTPVFQMVQTMCR